MCPTFGVHYSTFDASKSGWTFKGGPSFTKHMERKAILNWCSRFGLLGILPHSALSISLPVTITSSTWNIARDGVEKEHVRMNGKWITRDRDAFTHAEMTRLVAEAKGLRTESTRGRCISKSGKHSNGNVTVLFKDEILPGLRGSVPLANLLPRFFPGSEENDEFACPRPLTGEFWQIYTERWGDFRLTLLAFLEALGPVPSHLESGNLTALERFLEPAGVSLGFDSEGRVQEQWVCPSLLSSFARMFLQDILEGSRILVCDSCGRPVVTSAYQGRYCSQQCGWRHRKRRARTQRDSGTEATHEA